MAEIIKIDSHTWRIEDGFVRFFLLEGETLAAMIDSGINCPNAVEIAQTLTDKPIILINTHSDGDHTSGTGAFSKIYMHKLDYTNAELNIKYPETQLVEIDDDSEIEIGNRTLKIIHIPGHTSGSIAILDVKNRVLYAGDSVQKGFIYMFGNNREPDKYEKSLDKIISLKKEYDWIYASHDEFCVPNDYAEKVKNAWQQVQSGNVPFEMADLFGNKVKAYSTDVCGFYLE